MGIHKWIGSVPDEWPTAALWILGQRTNDKNYGLKEKNLLSLSYGNVIRKDIKDKTGLRPASYETYQIVEPGDVIFRFTDLQNDHRSLRSALVTERGIMTSAYINFRPDSSRVHPDFIAYFMRAMDQAKVFYEMGTGVRQTLNYEEFSRLEVPVPPLPTQRAIADYLDRETAELDGMRAELDEMERLLTERRAAVISETMLHLAEEYPNVQVGTLVKLVSGSGFPHKHQGKVGEELPFYKVGSISLVDRQGFIRDDRNTISSEEAHQLAAHIIPANSVLMAKIGAALLLGRFVRNSIACCIDNNMLALIPGNNVDSSFLMLSLSLVDIELLEKPGPVPTLDLTGLRQNRIPLPPLAEQRRIADEIDGETAEIDSMLEDITKLRDLLAERRAAVISAAVTGQIDIPDSLDDKDKPHA